MDFFSEKQIEQRLSAAVKKSSGLALKFVSPSFAGMPDRLVLLPDGKMAFVEVKVLGKKPRPLQVKRHEMLFVLDCASDIPGVMEKIAKGGKLT